MKWLLAILRVAVGALFVFSGLVKLNDPTGTAIKLEEYFEVFAQDVPSMAGFFEAFIPFALPLALAFCVAEVVLGVALLIGYKMKITTWVTLGLIVFFTFLTWYSATYNKVTDCGCFGDFIKLKPWESFYKDVVLLLATIVLVVFRNRLNPETTRFQGNAIVLGSIIGTGFLGYWAIEHLPYFDWRPYKIGASIPANMKVSEPLKYMYTMEKNGEKQQFDQYPEDTTWTFVSMELLNPGAMPKITDYRVWNDEADYTDSSFQGNKFIVIVQSKDAANRRTFAKARQTVADLEQLDKIKVDVWAITSLDAQSFEEFRHEVQLPVPYYYGDATVLKTIMRPKLGFWLLQNGVVKGKWHFNNTPSAQDVEDALYR